MNSNSGIQGVATFGLALAISASAAAQAPSSYLVTSPRPADSAVVMESAVEPPTVVARGFPSLSPRVITTETETPETVETADGRSMDFGLDGQSMSSLITVGSSLAIVLALFSALVWVSRRFGQGSTKGKSLPASLVSPIGHTMLDPRTKLMLLKCGNRVLVVTQTSGGVTPLTEITDPEEIREVMAQCSSESRRDFERTIRQIEREPAAGFTEAPMPTPSPQRLFASA
ncbi:MAG: flagellar biosynthetic protein FliO [Planctomycetota bacterium]